MLAYRHAFHAGNHADVLKHLVLMLVLEHMNRKDKGWRYVDTHAGAGGYSLQSDYARKNAEHAHGIAELWERPGLHPAVVRYLDQVRAFNPGSRLEQYPGSPAIAQALRRPQDELHLYELHPTDHRILASWLEAERGVTVRMADGFEGLRAELPPPTRRAVVLMDPSYELERDYTLVLTTLRESLARFAQGTYIVWYPQVGRVVARELPKRLQALAHQGWLNARMTVQPPDAQGFGLVGSGVFVINPPHTLHADLQAALPGVHAALNCFEGGSWRLDQRAA